MQNAEWRIQTAAAEVILNSEFRMLQSAFIHIFVFDRSSYGRNHQSKNVQVRFQESI